MKTRHDGDDIPAKASHQQEEPNPSVPKKVPFFPRGMTPFQKVILLVAVSLFTLLILDYLMFGVSGMGTLFWLGQTGGLNWLIAYNGWTEILLLLFVANTLVYRVEAGGRVFRCVGPGIWVNGKYRNVTWDGVTLELLESVLEKNARPLPGQKYPYFQKQAYREGFRHITFTYNGEWVQRDPVGKKYRRMDFETRNLQIWRDRKQEIALIILKRENTALTIKNLELQRHQGTTANQLFAEAGGAGLGGPG